MVYLDYAASTVIDDRVLEEMLSVYEGHPGNASTRTHLYGEDCRQLVERSREEVACLTGSKADEVVFTSGATESDNLAIMGLLGYGVSIGKKHIVSTSIEHKAVLACLNYAESLGFEVDLIKPGETGSVSADSVTDAVRDDTLLVSVMHVNNETGSIQPVIEIGERLSLLSDPPFFHVDAAQSAGKLVDAVSALKYDLLSICAHKMYGPQGIGALVARKKEYKAPPLKAIAQGGGQEGGLRSGTLPVALIAGLGEAARICREEWKSDLAKTGEIRARFVDLFEKSGVRFEINASENVLSNIMSVRFPGVSSEALMIVGKPYFAISNGSACNAQSYAPSYVLQEMGLNTTEAMESVRISWGRNTDVDEALEASQRISEIVKAYQ